MSEGGGSSGPESGSNYTQTNSSSTYSNPPSQPPTPSSTVQDPPSTYSSQQQQPQQPQQQPQQTQQPPQQPQQQQPQQQQPETPQEEEEEEENENSNEGKPTVTNLNSNSASGLPPFSSFGGSEVNEGLGGRLAGDGYLTSDGITSTRVMELSGWDYCYSDSLSGRYLERGESMPVMIPQPQYRPWESKQDGSSDSVKSTLPSFQSQFGEELVTTLTTLTPAACSPAPSVPSPSLPSFHTLSAVNPRYPLVSAPVQAREIPSIQQQFLDERHIHLFQGPPGQNFTIQPQNGLNGQTLTTLNNATTLTTLNNAQYHPQIINNAQILPSGQIITPQSHILAPSSQIISSNGHIITSTGGQGLTVVSQNSTPTVLTVVKTEPVNIVELKPTPVPTEPPNITQIHHGTFQNPLVTQGQQMDSKFGLESPPRGVDGRKKERRKIRASSMESSNESDGAMSVESSGQVAAVSSTASFKSPMTPGQMNNEDTGEKQTKKKRKRCGECIGCQRKDNCGDCAPCRNDKSHQICKMRRCEKLTEKKHLLAYNREDGGVSYRGRGRGRGRGSRGGYRGKGSRPGSQAAQVTSVVGEMNSAPGLVVGSNRENVKVEGGRVSSGPIPGNPTLAPAMAVPFYAAGTEVWSAATPADPWASQGQFIHQIDDIRYQHYPGYQPAVGYQQTGFIAEQPPAFQPQYANNANGNPATSPAQGNVTPRSSGSYTQVHTPTPSPNPPTPHVNGHRNGINVHYVEENYVNGSAYNTESTMVPPGSTTPNSRSSSVHLETNDSNTKTSGYMSGNEIPGYPLNSPQCQSSCNSSGYPGQSIQSEYGDRPSSGNSYQSSNGTNQKSPSSYPQVSPGTYQNYQNFNHSTGDDHQKPMKTSISPGSSHPSQKSAGMYPQSSPKSYSSNPSPQTYQDMSPGQNRNAAVHYDNRTIGNGSMYQSERFNPTPSPGSQTYGQFSPSHANQDKTNVNARIKSMIMNKQQMSQNIPNNNFSVTNENHIMSPGHYHHHHHQQQQQQHQQHQIHSQHHLMSPNRQMISNNQMNSPNSKDSNNFPDKDNSGDRKQPQIKDNSKHFLAFSHHLREGRVLQPEGGGVQNWTRRTTSGFNYPLDNYNELRKPNRNIPSAMENFMKFASADFNRKKPFAGYKTEERIQDPIHNLEVNFPTKKLTSSCQVEEAIRDYKPTTFQANQWKSPYSQPVKQEEPPTAVKLNASCYRTSYCVKTEYLIGRTSPKIKSEDIRSECFGLKTHFVTSPTTKVEYPKFSLAIKKENDDSSEESLYPKISYAPNTKNMEVIDRRFDKCELNTKLIWEEYLKERGEEKSVKKEKEDYLFQGDGGPIVLEKCSGSWCCRLGGTETPTIEHLVDGVCQGFQTADELLPNKADNALTPNDGSSNENVPVTSSETNSKSPTPDSYKDFQENLERMRNNLRADVPDCRCFPPDKFPPEPGSFYTHLGAASSLSDLRKEVETRTGQRGKAVRIEKICYTGKEGKTTQGCPLAKWIIRRSGAEEKFLIIVKHRQGHTCSTAWIVVCLVAWEGVPSSEADKVYSLLTHKLNRFGLPTTRRCATNEPRTCACQGLDPDTCGASFSFGCSWSMYYNGCKYARSKTVRKFRLSVRSEEQEVEERMHVLATLLSPLYHTLAPNAFRNQTMFEREASECRLGFKPGRPFSGVTACIDFCAHSHRDLHNMNNGCTVVVTLTKHRSLSKPEDEQLHVLPLYIMDETDEFGCKESQEAKYKDGSIECLKKFPCEVRVRAVPLQPCRRHGKKRKEEDPEGLISCGRSKEPNPKNLSPMGMNNNASPLQPVDLQSMMDSLDLQLQSSQVSSTVMDSPSSLYQGWAGQNTFENEIHSGDGSWNRSWNGSDGQRKQNWLDCQVAQWEYPGFPIEREVGPDSTTNQNQLCSAMSNRCSNSNTAFVGCSNLPMKPTFPNQWNRMRQTINEDISRMEEDRENGIQKTSPQQWPDYSITSSHSPFRMPKGRPPSTHNSGSYSDHCETYLKPKEIPQTNYNQKDMEVCGQNPFGYSPNPTESPNCNQTLNDPKQCSPSSWSDISNYQHFPNTPESWESPTWDLHSSNSFFPLTPETPKSEPIGEVIDYIDNEECFKDSQMGGVAIALSHGSVLFECAKHELHATTALRKPNRLHPTRISLVFYQHRNLNRAKHGWDEWEEKMRLRKLGITTPDKSTKDFDKFTTEYHEYIKLGGLDKPLGLGEKILLRMPTYTTTTWTTLFPMRPCMVTGPYQERGSA